MSSTPPPPDTLTRGKPLQSSSKRARNSSNRSSTTNNNLTPIPDFAIAHESSLHTPRDALVMAIQNVYQPSVYDHSRTLDAFGYPLNLPIFDNSQPNAPFNTHIDTMTQNSEGFQDDFYHPFANEGVVLPVADGQYDYGARYTTYAPNHEGFLTNSSEENGFQDGYPSYMGTAITTAYNPIFPDTSAVAGTVPGFTTAFQQYGAGQTAFDLPFDGLLVPGPSSSNATNPPADLFWDWPLPRSDPPTSIHFNMTEQMARITHPRAAFAHPGAFPQAFVPSTNISTYQAPIGFLPEAPVAGPSRVTPPHGETLQPLADPMGFGIPPDIPPSSMHCGPEVTSRKYGPRPRAPRVIAHRWQPILESGQAAVPGVSLHELPSSTQSKSNTNHKEKKSGKAKPVKSKRARKDPYVRSETQTDGLIPLPPKKPLGSFFNGILHFEVTASAHRSLFSLLPDRTSDHDLPGMKYLPIPYPVIFERAVRYLPPTPLSHPSTSSSTPCECPETVNRKPGRPKKVLAYLGYLDECACVCGRGFGADHSTADHIRCQNDTAACEVYRRQRRAPDITRCIFCKEAMPGNWAAHFSCCVLLREVRTLILKDHIEEDGLLPCEIDVFPWPAAGLGDPPSKKKK